MNFDSLEDARQYAKSQRHTVINGAPWKPAGFSEVEYILSCSACDALLVQRPDGSYVGTLLDICYMRGLRGSINTR